MLPYAKWTADYLYERICYESYSLFEHRVATPSLIRQLEDLFSPFEALRNMSSSAQYGVEFYEFYFRIPWKRQAKATKKRTKKWEWLCLCFRRDHYRGDVYYAIQIGHSIILDVFDGNGLRGKDGYETMAKCEWIKPLKDLVAILMSSIKDGIYAPFIQKHLDYRLRKGKIRYKDYWSLYPAEGKRHFAKYKGVDVDAFQKHIAQGGMSQEKATHFPLFTANEYCRLFLLGASALGLQIADGLSLQENYLLHSDKRTLGLNAIDGESPQAFDEWYESVGPHFDHAFEYAYWKNQTRIDLRIEKDDNGYYLWITCGPENDAAMRVFLALAEHGVFARIVEPEEYMKRYRGDSLRPIGGLDWHGDGGFPNTKIKAFIQVVAWEELELASLKEQ